MIEMNSEISSKSTKVKAKDIAVDDSCVMWPSLVAAAKIWRNFAKESDSMRSSPYSQSMRYYSKLPMKSYNRQFVPLDISRSNMLQLVTKTNNISKQGNAPSEKLQFRGKSAKNKKLIISNKESDASSNNENVITLRKINMMTKGRTFANNFKSSPKTPKGVPSRPIIGDNADIEFITFTNDTKSSSLKTPKRVLPKPIIEDNVDIEFDEVFGNTEKQFHSNTLVTDYPIYTLHEIVEPVFYNAGVMELRSVAPRYTNRAVIYDVIQTFEQVIHYDTALVIEKATINETGNDEIVVLDAMKDEMDFKETAKDELIILLDVTKDEIVIKDDTEDRKLSKKYSVAEISYVQKSSKSEADKRDMPSCEYIFLDSNQETEAKILILYNIIFVFAFVAMSFGELFSFI